MKKTTEEYKNSLLKPIHKGLQNGMSVKQLSKRYSIFIAPIAPAWECI